jgi:formylglycine-generating enzyme required for sulfatase activity
MLAVMSSNAETKARADAGETLGRLGDPRQDLKAFVTIPPGTYNLSMGEVEIETPFEIGKYPVTNGWFREFVKAGGYEKTDLWTPEGRKWLAHTKAKAPRFWHDRKWNNPSAPVVGVCWWEAAAFLEWLTRSRDDGWRYGLPSEIQWEAAAAGKEGKGKYPWRGDWAEDHCNSEEAGLGKTSVVGVFPKGDTPDGVVDLSGNVWEWLGTDYQSKSELDDFRFETDMQSFWEKIENSSGEERDKLIDQYVKMIDKEGRQNPVLRGGGWFYDRYFVARADRYRFFPNRRVNFMGFRAARTLS